MQPQTLTRQDVITAIQDLAKIPNAAELLPYLGRSGSAHHGRVSAAVQAGDADVLAAYCATAIQDALKTAGLEVSIEPPVLRAIAQAPDGWQMIHDVTAQRENAAHLLKQRIARYLMATAGRNQAPPAPPAPSEQRMPAQPPPPPMQRREPPPPPRRHDDSGTVRQIGEARRARDERLSGPQSQTEATYDTVKVHGGKSALTLEATTTRRADAPTINIEAARIKDPAARTYDWANKIIIQLTTSELQQVTCLLYGMIDHVKFQNHGPANDKWFEIQRQTGQYAGTIKFAVGQGKEMCIVQLTPADLGDVMGLFIRQCSRQMKIQQSALYSALRPLALMLNEHRNRGGGGNARAG